MPNAGADRERSGDWTPRRLWPLALVAAAVALFFVFGLQRFLTPAEFQARRGELAAAVQDHFALAVLVFMSIYAAVVALSIPGAVFLTLAGGCLFGALVATLCVIVAATLGSVLVFLAARTSLRGLLAARAGPWLARLDRGFRRDQWSYMLFLRLMPIIPFFVVNLCAALLDVSFACFVIATFVGIIPATAIYALAGAGIGDVLDTGGTITIQGVLTPKLIAGLVGLALLAALPALYRYLRRARRGNDPA